MEIKILIPLPPSNLYLYLDILFFFFLSILSHTLKKNESTPYCSVDKYSDRGGGGEKRKIHRSFVERCLHPLESSLQYERSHLPDKGTNNRSLLLSYPPPPLLFIFLVAPVNRKRRFGRSLDSGIVRSRDKGPISRRMSEGDRFFRFVLSLWSGVIRIICPISLKKIF